MRRPLRSRGFSIVEVMVALVISALLLGGLVITFTNTNANYGELTKAGRQIENGRYAVSVIETDVRHAGYWGEYTGSLVTYDSTNPPVLAVPQPCSDGPVQFKADIQIAVYGWEGQAAPPLNCLPNYKPDTDVLMVRRASTLSYPKASLNAATVYFQGYLDPPDGKGPYLDYGSGGPWDGTYVPGAVPIHPFVERVYYIANCHNCAGAGDGIPTLTMIEYVTGTAQFNLVPIAEGIEQMRLRYGVDNSLLYNGTPYKYLHAGAMALGDWPNVMTVEINLLARNTEPTRNYSDKKSYTLGDVPVAADGQPYRRHEFSQVARLINVSSRRQN